MIIFLWAALLSCAIIFWLTIGHLIRLRLVKRYPPTFDFSVAVIVPCKGNNDPNFGNNLLSIIQQDYAGPVQFIFCVESPLDPALPTLRQLQQQHQHVHICVAGLATASAQKTFNILKGMFLAPAETDIFLFADADIQPHPTWLQEMVAPFQEPDVGAATGCFHRIPLSESFRLGEYIAGLFGASIVAGISDDWLKGLWGGSLALRKSIITQYDIQARLATHIVDDIAVMQLLRRHKIKRRYVPSCTLKSYCDMSVADSIEWFTRQLQFSQIYLKDLYIFYHIMIIPYAFTILAAPVVLVYGLVSGNLLAIKTSLAFWLSVMLAGLFLRLGVPVNPAGTAPDDRKYRLLSWMLVTPIAFVYGGWALLNTHFRVKNGILTMYWRSIEYRVEVKSGRVLQVIRQPSEAHQPAAAGADWHQPLGTN
jgi:cellulose synthase/poly-beta-1,6-N-acetylglucosamine synthase-like glycosyltransferase